MKQWRDEVAFKDMEKGTLEIPVNFSLGTITTSDGANPPKPLKARNCPPKKKGRTLRNWKKLKLR